jgi:hypothetical protein
MEKFQFGGTVIIVHWEYNLYNSVLIAKFVKITLYVKNVMMEVSTIKKKIIK